MAGQHQVEDDEIDADVGHNLPHLAPITCDRDPITVFAQEFCHELPDLAVIIDEEDVCLALDGSRLLQQGSVELVMTTMLAPAARSSKNFERLTSRPSVRGPDDTVLLVKTRVAHGFTARCT